MKLRFTKPRKGKTTVTLDDRRGQTRMKEVLEDVDVADFTAQVKPMVDRWAQRRADIANARKPKIA